MAESDAGETDALARLEAALDRIARHASQPSDAAPAMDTGAIAARLDGLIGQLRDALAVEA